MTTRLSMMAAGAFVLIGGCATYPYETAFQACDEEAGACYRFCEEEPDEGAASRCRADCEERANLCFSDAYGGSGYASSAYGYGYTRRPWYGRYGYWYPDSGYILSFDYYSGGYYGRPYGRYGRRGGRHYHGDGHNHSRYGDGRRGGRDRRDHDDRGRGDMGTPPPPSGTASPPPTAQPTTPSRPIPRTRPPVRPAPPPDADTTTPPPPRQPERRPREQRRTNDDL